MILDNKIRVRGRKIGNSSGFIIKKEDMVIEPGKLYFIKVEEKKDEIHVEE